MRKKGNHTINPLTFVNTAFEIETVALENVFIFSQQQLIGRRQIELLRNNQDLSVDLCCLLERFKVVDFIGGVLEIE